MSVINRVRSLFGKLSSPPPALQTTSAGPAEKKDVGPNMRRALVRARTKQPIPDGEHPGVIIAQERAEQLRKKVSVP